MCNLWEKRVQHFRCESFLFQWENCYITMTTSTCFSVFPVATPSMTILTEITYYPVGGTLRCSWERHLCILKGVRCSLSNTKGARQQSRQMTASGKKQLQFQLNEFISGWSSLQLRLVSSPQGQMQLAVCGQLSKKNVTCNTQGWVHWWAQYPLGVAPEHLDLRASLENGGQFWRMWRWNTKIIWGWLDVIKSAFLSAHFSLKWSSFTFLIQFSYKRVE